MLTKLQAVNNMLALMGEHPVNTTEDDHPMVPKALDKLAQEGAKVQADLLWFNVEYPVLVPQAITKNIIVPNDTASVDSLTQSPRLAVRGTKLFNLDDSTDKFDQPIRVRLHRVLAFEDMPITARAHVMARAEARFNLEEEGDPNKQQVLNTEIIRTGAALKTESIRNARANLLYRPSVVATLGNIVGDRPKLGGISSRSWRRIGG